MLNPIVEREFDPAAAGAVFVGGVATLYGKATRFYPLRFVLLDEMHLFNVDADSGVGAGNVDFPDFGQCGLHGASGGGLVSGNASVPPPGAFLQLGRAA